MYIAYKHILTTCANNDISVKTNDVILVQRWLYIKGQCLLPVSKPIECEREEGGGVQSTANIIEIYYFNY